MKWRPGGASAKIVVMKDNRLARLMRNSEPAIGVWTTLADPGIAIIFEHAGFDWLLVDNEHQPFTEDHIQAFILALRASDMSCIVRVRGNDRTHIQWVLDTGADGIIVPMIQDADDAQRAVQAAKYHPIGSRGYSPVRATDFWYDQQAYDEAANERILMICQIEQTGAVDDIERIVTMPGIDGIWIGPSDLAQAMGYHGNFEHQAVQAAVEKVIAAANKHRMPWGIPVATAEAMMKYVDRGALIMTAGTSSRFLTAMADERYRACFDAVTKAGLRQS